MAAVAAHCIVIGAARGHSIHHVSRVLFVLFVTGFVQAFFSASQLSRESIDLKDNLAQPPSVVLRQYTARHYMGCAGLSAAHHMSVVCTQGNGLLSMH